MLRFPHITLWSYVDNIEIICSRPDQVEQGMRGLEQFCHLLDLPIDQHKTYVWSLDSAGRQTLKSLYAVKKSARDLGAHVQYSAQSTNTTVKSKLDRLPLLWNRLARSQSTYKNKFRAIQAKAWPAALHAIASVHLGDDHFTTMRAGATKALGVSGPGFSAIAHLSLVELAKHDPQFYALVTTILQFRVYHADQDRVSFVMGELQGETPKTNYGPAPTSMLLARLRQVGWGWQQSVGFHDHTGRRIALLTAPIQELQARLQNAWQLKVQRQIQERKTMKGISHACPQLTTENRHAMSSEDQALLTQCLNGTYFTGDHLKHVNHDAHQQMGDACRFCGLADSQTLGIGNANSLQTAGLSLQQRFKKV